MQLQGTIHLLSRYYYIGRGLEHRHTESSNESVKFLPFYTGGNDLPKDIGSFTVLPLQHFGSHVFLVTFALESVCRNSWPNGSHAKVTDLEPTIPIDEDVRWLQIKVDYPVIMNEQHSLSIESR